MEINYIADFFNSIFGIITIVAHLIVVAVVIWNERAEYQYRTHHHHHHH